MYLDEEKYIVFKRSVFDDCLTDTLKRRMHNLALKDAVVIRRQDAFASPCLLTYAAMISMVAKHHPDKKIKEELLAIADYFHEQGVLSGDEDSKLPTL